MSSDWTRRDFLQKAAALSAAMAAAQAMGQTKPASQATRQRKREGLAPTTTGPAQNAKLRVGIIGCANKGGHNLRAIAECGVTIAGLCDIDSKMLAPAAEAYPAAKTFADYRKMLETMKDSLDAVVVSTPDHCHAPAAMFAMNLGKHVYCEKPLTHNISEARLLAKTAQEKKLITQMGNQGHSSEGSAQQVAWLKSGVIGDVTEVHVWTDRPHGVWPQGLSRPTDAQPVPENIAWDLWLGPAPVRPYHSGYHPFAWRGWWDFGTGALGDMACHIMDTAYWALDLKNPTAVEAFSEGGTSESGPLWSIIRYEFPQRGALPPVKLFWYDGKVLPSTKFGSSEKLTANGVVFVGTKGTMAAPLNSEPRILEEKLAKEFAAPAKPTTRPGGFDHYHHLEFVEACLGSGKLPGSNFSYSGPLTETVLLGNFAIRSNRRIEWDAVAARCTNLPEANQYVTREYRKGWEL